MREGNSAYSRSGANSWDSYWSEFLRVLSILEDYLPHIVLIGGCVPYIYWKCAHEEKAPPVHTTDLDILTSNRVPFHASPIASLLDGAGYKGRVLELRHAQCFKFESGTVPGFEVEFLTPAPRGRHVDTLVVQKGLRAQVLPGLEVLLARNKAVTVTGSLEGDEVDFLVRVPTPGAFVLNKAASYLDPYGEQVREKDIYYVYYMLRLLPDGKKALVDSMRECASPPELRVLASRLRPLFSDEFSPGTRQVAEQLSSLEMAERNVRLLVLAEFDEFISLLET